MFKWHKIEDCDNLNKKCFVGLPKFAGKLVGRENFIYLFCCVRLKKFGQ
jgi:hypothetical protein